MRIVLAISALLLNGGAIAQPPALDTLPSRPQTVLPKDELTDPSASAVCRDRIDQAREERGLPKLSRDNSAPTDPLLIAAVDKRIGGCSVMVMRNNTSDIRPLPQFRDGPAKLTPLVQ